MNLTYFRQDPFERDQGTRCHQVSQRLLRSGELKLIPIPHSTPRALLSEASKVWEQLTSGTGSVGKGGSSMPTHYLPASLEAHFEITGLGPQASTSSLWVFFVHLLKEIVLDGLMNS